MITQNANAQRQLIKVIAKNQGLSKYDTKQLIKNADWNEINSLQVIREWNCSVKGLGLPSPKAVVKEMKAHRALIHKLQEDFIIVNANKMNCDIHSLPISEQYQGTGAAFRIFVENFVKAAYSTGDYAQGELDIATIVINTVGYQNSPTKFLKTMTNQTMQRLKKKEIAIKNQDLSPEKQPLQLIAKGETQNQMDLGSKLLHRANSNYIFVNEAYTFFKQNEKKLHKRISSQVDKKLQKMEDIAPPFLMQHNNSYLLGLSYVLDLQNGTTPYITKTHSIGIKELKKYIDDKNFKIFYRKLLIVFTFYKENQNFLDWNNQERIENIDLLLNIEGIILTYFLCREKNMTMLKIQSFFSKIINWESTIVSFSSALNPQQERIFNQIKTGIKYSKEKEDATRSNSQYTKSNHRYNILDDMKNNIKIKYVSGKDGKHSEHKSPIQHIRKEHYRQYGNKRIFIKEMIVGEVA